MKVTFVDILIVFVALFAVIDITASIPVIIEIKHKTIIQILKRIFGIILLAIAISLFISNTGIKLGHVS